MPSSPLDDHTAALYTVGQVADLLGVQTAFLRRLDTEEIVQPARSAGGQRRYSRDEIAEIERVAVLTGEGLTLPGIRRIVALQAELDATLAELERERTKHQRRR